MNRDYEHGQSDTVRFFTGIEIEHTPAKGMQTLFVVGLHSIEEIEYHVTQHPNNIEHIFFGANHSYDPFCPDQHDTWETMIKHFLEKGYLCSLDIPFNQVDEFHEGGLCEYDNFIPQIRISIPYIKLWNYNTTIKIDDKDFKATNPGVWSHSLHTLMNRENFTSWNEYKNDKIIK